MHLFRHIGGSVVDGVALHAHHLGFDHGWAFATVGALHRFIRSVVNLAGISAVDDHRRHAITDSPVGQVFYVYLVFRGGGIGPKIAFDDQHQPEFPDCRKVNTLIAHAGGLAAVADPGQAG